MPVLYSTVKRRRRSVAGTSTSSIDALRDELVMRVDLLRPRNSSLIKRGTSSHTILAGGVRWFDAKHAMMLISRAPAAAVYTGRQPNERRRAPTTTEPTPDKVFVETVLVLFNVTTGAVLEQIVLPRTSWFFLSNRELFHHNFNPNNEWYETFTIDWKPR